MSPVAIEVRHPAVFAVLIVYWAPHDRMLFDHMLNLQP